MRTTAQMRALWGPPCTEHRGTMRGSYRALDDVLRRHGYAPDGAQTGSCNCRKITGGTNYSLHAYFDGERFTFFNGVTIVMGLAVDINWRRNPYGPKLVTDMPRPMIEDVLAIRTLQGVQVWGWGGHYKGNKDAMHFEILASPAELAAGVRSAPETRSRIAGVTPGEAPTPCSGAASHPTIRRGARGAAVSHLQQLLITSGASIQADGIFGGGTEGAVRNHQTWLRDVRHEPLDVDGIVGPKTWRAMHDVLSATTG